MNKEQVILDTNTGVEGVMEVCELPVESGGKFVKILVGAFGIAAAAGVTIGIVKSARKHNSKLHKLTKEERMIKKLEDKGYTILAPIGELVDDDEINPVVEGQNN